MNDIMGGRMTPLSLQKEVLFTCIERRGETDGAVSIAKARHISVSIAGARLVYCLS